MTNKLQQTLKESPKSFKLLKEFVIHGLQVMQQMMSPEDAEGVTFPDLNEFIGENEVNQVIQANPRTLYEFFDNQGIYVNTTVRKTGTGPWWTFTFGGFQDTESEDFAHRIEAELAGFDYAFKILETK